MVIIIKQKQLRLPISIVQTKSYKQGSCMITIGKIPKKLQSFFKPVKKQVSEHVYGYFWSMVLSSRSASVMAAPSTNLSNRCVTVLIAQTTANSSGEATGISPL